MSQEEVEKILGCRVVRVSPPSEFTTGVQVQRIGKKGKVTSVAPSDELALRMFEMLCMPKEEWPRDGTGT
jgi:hypothetical protein